MAGFGYIETPARMAGLPNFSPAAHSVGAIPHGVHGDVAVPLPATQAWSGRHINEFGGEYFNKLIIDPRYLNFGVIAGYTEYSIEAHSTYLDDITLTAADIVGDTSGVNLLDIAAGDTIKSFGKKDFRLALLEEGPTYFDFKIRVTVDNAEDYWVLGYGESDFMSGFRAQEWFYPINYADPVAEVYEYATDIIEAWSGMEQRFDLLDEPNHTLHNNYLLDGSDYVEAMNKLNGWHDKVFLVPNKNQHIELWGVQAGSTQLTIPGHAFSPNGLVMLRGNMGDYSVLAIASITSDTITLRSQVPKTYDYCEAIYVDLYYMDSNLNARVHRGELLEMQVPFVAREDTYVHNVNPDSAGLTYYKGLPVLDFQHNFADSLEQNMRYEDVGVGYKSTIRERLSRKASTEMNLNFDLTGEQIARFKAFAHLVKGRWGSFWVPDHSSSFVQKVGGQSINATIDVRASGYTTLSAGLYRHVKIDTAVGTFHREMLSVESFGDYDTITLDAAIPQEAHDSIHDIRLLYKARFGNDRFSYEFHHDQYASIDKTVVISPAMQ